MLICAFCYSSLTPYGVNCFLISHSLQLASFQGLGLIWSWAFLPLAILFCFFHSLVTVLAMLLCHSYCGDIWTKLAGPLWACCLFFSQWLNMVIGFILMLLWAFLLHCLWAPLSHLFLLEHPWPICFPWSSLALFSNYAFPWTFTNSFGLP